jgi:hypothetical protein
LSNEFLSETEHKRREKMKIHTIHDEKGVITTNSKEIQRTMKEYLGFIF